MADETPDTRDALAARLKDALRAKDALAASTIRLALAALKDRDIAARADGNAEGVDEGAVVALLESMVKQRRESIVAYRNAGREELAEREEAEVGILKAFLPEQIEGEELVAVVDAAIAELNATSVKDMGRVMAALRQRYPGQVDARAAGAIAKTKLGG